MPIYMRNMGEEMPYSEVQAGWVFRTRDGIHHYLKTSADEGGGNEFVDLCLSDGEDLYADVPENEDAVVTVVSKDPQISIKL